MNDLLNEKQIEQYKKIYKEYYGMDIGRDKAYEQGIKLIELYKNISKNINIKRQEKKNGSFQKSKNITLAG